MTRGRDRDGGQSVLPSGMDRAQECSPLSLLQGGCCRPGTGTSWLELGRACESQDGTEWAKEHHGSTKQCFCFAVKSGLLTSPSEDGGGWDGKDDVGRISL